MKITLLELRTKLVNKIRLIGITLMLFGFSQAIFGQVTGDYKSVASGDWTTLATWQYYNGSGWVNLSTIPSQGYPGQYNNVGTVTITDGTDIILNTSIPFPPPSGTYYSLSNLVIGNGVSGSLLISDNYQLNALIIKINTNGLLKFVNNKELKLPDNAVISLNGGKLDESNCTNNVALYIGNVKYAVCSGQGNSVFTFDDLNNSSGSINAIPSYVAPACTGTNLLLKGDFSGAVGSTPSYSWVVYGPNGFSVNGSAQDLSIQNPVAGDYTATLTVRTTLTDQQGNVFTYTNFETILIKVYAMPVIYDVTGGGSYCAGGLGVSLGLSNSEIGRNYQLRDGSNTNIGSAVAGTGSSISFGNQTVAGTYTVVATNGDCLSTMNGTATVTVYPLPTIAGVTQLATVCSGSSAVINLNGLLPNRTSTINYSINGNAQTPIAGIISDGSGSGSFTTPNLVAGQNGQILQITSIETTSSIPSCSQSFAANVTLAVSTPPVFTTCPGVQTVNTVSGSCSAVVDYIASVSGTPTPMISYTFSGATIGTGSGTGAGLIFNKGVTNVVITASNGCAPDATCSFTVTVIDNIDPTITCPAAVSVNVDAGSCVATGVALGTPVFGDNCTGSTVSNNAPSSFPIGNTTVTWTVTDASNRTASCSQIVTVIDNIAPVADVTSLPAITGQCSATIASAPTATDNCGGVIIGTTSDLLTRSIQGRSTVTWIFTDVAGNFSTQTQDIVVDDTTAPVTPVIADITGQCSVTPTTPTTTDDCAGTITGSTTTVFPITTQGTTVVTWTFNDGNGQMVTANQNVIVTASPVVPSIVSVAANCSAAGTSIISNYNALNTYVFSPSGPTVGVTGLISGMVAGTSYTVISSNGSCPSVASASFSNASVICAQNDDAGVIDGSRPLAGILNAIANDTFNGAPINLSDVILTFAPRPNFTMETNGLLNTLANIPGGTYTLTYNICERANPNNCSTATITVFVSSPSIALVKKANFNDENTDGYAQAGETITYSFEVTNRGNVPLTNVNIVDPLPGVTISGAPLNLGVGETNTSHFQGTYTIKQTDINAGAISNQATVFGTSPNGRVVEDKSDDTDVDSDNPTVLAVSGCVVKVYNAVTPDGSDKYDKLVIRGLECYPDNSIQIFNRWGALVFEREHYNNDDVVFRGISEGKVTVEKSQELPAGTYFYILKYKDNNSNAFEKSGYLYLNRK